MGSVTSSWLAGISRACVRSAAPVQCQQRTWWLRRGVKASRAPAQRKVGQMSRLLCGKDFKDLGQVIDAVNRIMSAAKGDLKRFHHYY
ncbi:hypothetical protein KCP74_10565 [Salmonella enterica subsp. enterica]|nr:hypothetical protein KCP74_10565 [Salmonella enterica subsp. enterica]